MGKGCSTEAEKLPREGDDFDETPFGGTVLTIFPIGGRSAVQLAGLPDLGLLQLWEQLMVPRVRSNKYQRVKYELVRCRWHRNRLR